MWKTNFHKLCNRKLPIQTEVTIENYQPETPKKLPQGYSLHTRWSLQTKVRKGWKTKSFAQASQNTHLQWY